MRRWSEVGRRKAAVAVVLGLTSTAAWAPAPVYFDLAGFIWIALAILVGLGALIGAVVAGQRGAFVVGGLVAVLLSVAAVYLDIQASQKSAAREADLKSEREFMRQVCLDRAGYEVFREPLQAERIELVMPSSGSSNWIFRYYDRKKLPPHARVVSSLPEVREPGVAYVEVKLDPDPVPNTNGRLLTRLTAIVSDASNQTVGSFTDYTNSREWCLGDPAPSAVERFVFSMTGLALGLRREPTPTNPEDPGVPIYSPIATVGSVEPGHFFPRPRLGSSEAPESMPPDAQCTKEGTRYSDYWICLKETEAVNHVSAYARGLVSGSSWYVSAGKLRYEERDLQGRLLRVWQVRVPAESGLDLDSFGPYEFDVKDRQLQIHYGVGNRRSCPEAVHGCWSQRVVVHASLAPEFPKPRAPSR